MNRKRGFTLIELLVVMAIIALLVSLLLPALASARRTALATKDGTQIRGIHQSWIVYSKDHDSIFPVPGLIDRKPVDVGNGTQEIPGRGEEDVEQNNHANLYSACIMQNYFSPEVCIGPTEPNGNVTVKDNYNFELYNPVNQADDVYWDPSFKADLEGTNGTVGANTSYATQVIGGPRRTLQWRNSLDSRYVILGNRGVRAGSIDSAEYGSSMTLQIHGPKKEWDGNIIYNDNHVSYVNTFWPEDVNYSLNGETKPDNIFQNDTTGDVQNGDPAGSDCCLFMNAVVFDGGNGTQFFIGGWD
ncbi:MAG TPA: type II secretion system protein [Phycisphaerales bacterium]|nr:type II secretion system protein [Phycisphaerales bacterium]